jgi:hypothetical protein
MRKKLKVFPAKSKNARSSKVTSLGNYSPILSFELKSCVVKFKLEKEEKAKITYSYDSIRLAVYTLQITIRHSGLLAMQWRAGQEPQNSIEIVLLPWRSLGEQPAATRLHSLQLVPHQWNPRDCEDSDRFLGLPVWTRSKDTWFEHIAFKIGQDSPLYYGNSMYHPTGEPIPANSRTLRACW